MKKLLLSCAFALLSIGAFAQLDLELTEIVSPANGTTIVTNTPFTVTFAVTNVGTTTLNPGDTVFYGMTINGGVVFIGGANIFFDVLTKTLAPNDSVHITISPASIDFWNFASGALANETSFTFGFNVRGTTCCPTLDDANIANNVMTLTLMNGSISIEETEIAEITSFYANGKLRIESTNPNNKLGVSIYNLTGKEVRNELIEGEGTIDLSSLPNGIYISKIISDSQVVDNKKFMKF